VQISEMKSAFSQNLALREDSLQVRPAELTPGNLASIQIMEEAENAEWTANRKQLQLISLQNHCALRNIPKDLICLPKAEEKRLKATSFKWRYPRKELRSVLLAGKVVFAGGEEIIIGLDAETGEQLYVDTHDKDFRQRFTEAAARRDYELKAVLNRLGIDTLGLSTDGDMVRDIVRFVRMRKQRKMAPASFAAFRKNFPHLTVGDDALAPFPPNGVHGHISD